MPVRETSMSKLALVLLAMPLACECSKAARSPETSGAPALKELKETEPNDTLATAILLRESTRVIADLKADATKPDEDLYRLEALGGNKVASFEVSGIPGVDAALELLDRDGNHLALFNSEAEGKPEKIANLNLASPYIVKVFASNKGSGGAYSATVTLADAQPDFEVEPNNRAVDAMAVELGKPVKGLVSDPSDEDWYRFEVPLPVAAPGEAPAGPAAAPADSRAKPEQPAVIRLDVTGVPGLRIQVEVSNQAQAVFYSARGREEGDGIQVRNLALRPGESSYFLTVKSAWVGTGKEAKRGYSTAAPYTLSLSQEDASANVELEPNDEPSRATLFLGDGSKQGFFAPKGDADYFLVKYDRPVLLKIELSGVDRLDSTLSLIKSAVEGEKEEILLRANDGGVKEGEILVNVAAGPGNDALLRVEAAARHVAGKWVRDQENPAEPYKLTITSRPDEANDEREPNHTVETATPIELGKTMRGLIHPKKDIDYFRLDLSRSPVKTALKAVATGILKVNISLGLYRVDDGGPKLVQRSEKGKGEQPETIRYSAEPGIYLLEVRDTKGWQSNFMDAYQLTVEQEQ
jgi:hypothetical protein